MTQRLQWPERQALDIREYQVSVFCIEAHDSISLVSNVGNFRIPLHIPKPDSVGSQKREQRSIVAERGKCLPGG